MKTQLALFFKAHVGPYLRGGKLVNVSGYQGRNARAVAAPGQRSLFGSDTPAARPHATETPEFKEWFGASKITDKAGKPRVMFHGTEKSFDAFKVGAGGYSGPAIWIAPQGEFQPTALGMGSHGNWRDGANVMPIYVRMERPLLIDSKTMRDWAVNTFANGDDNFPQLISARIVNDLKQAGYDGIIFMGTKLGWGTYSDEYVVFDPTQIKSATGNNGKFDRNNADITKSLPVVFVAPNLRPGLRV